MTDDTDLKRLLRYAAGECPPDELAVEERWIAQSAERLRATASLRELPDIAKRAVPDDVDVDALWQAFSSTTPLRTEDTRPVLQIMPANAAALVAEGVKRFGPHRPVRKAAGMAGSAAVTKLFRAWPRRDPGQHSLFRTMGFGVAAGAVFLALGVALSQWVTRGQRPAAERVAPQVYATGQGQRANVTLADGSTVVLAPGSRLRVAAEFAADRRDVYLEGEGYFRVRHDAGHPFTVLTATSATRDVGTAFSVRAYAEDGAVRVAVREGVVILSGAGSLRAGDIAHLAVNGTVTVRRQVDVEPALSWMHGEPTYDRAPLRAVLADLARWRGLVVTLANAGLGDVRFTGTLSGLSDTLAVAQVAASAGLRVFRDGRTLVLRSSPSLQPRN